MDSTDPTDPMENSEPNENADPKENADANDAALKADPNDAALAAEPALAAEAIDSREAAEAIERMLLREAMDVVAVVVFDMSGFLWLWLTLSSSISMLLWIDTVNSICQDRSMTDRSTPGDARDRLVAAARAELTERGLAGVSLRGIARRAEVSHAAPKYFFGDRAGLLTAIATAGFTELTDRLRAVGGGGAPGLGDLGRAYVHFGLEHPALFELMFRPDELHPDDPALQRAQAESIGVLASATTTIAVEGQPDDVPPVMALVSWAFAHGLVALVRDGALRSLGGGADATALADQLVGVFDGVVRRSPLV